MEAVRTLASAHPPTNGAQRGPDTPTVILFEIMRAPGTAARLFAEMPLQSLAVHLQEQHDCGRQSNTRKPYENLVKPNTFCSALGHCKALLQLTPPQTQARLGRSRTFRDAPGTARGRCASPRGNVVMISGTHSLRQSG